MSQQLGHTSGVWGSRGARSPVTGDRGFTLAETVVAISVIAISLGALLTSMTFGFVGVDGARRSTVAVFLAEQQMERIKASAMAANGAGWWGVVPANFPWEPYGSIPDHADYRRTVAITDAPGGAANTKQIEVAVFYRPPTTQGIGSETGVVVSTLLVRRQGS